MRTYVLCFFILFLAPALRAQVMGNYATQRSNEVVNHQLNFRAVPRQAVLAGNPREVNFTINALANEPASAYVAIFSVFQAGPTVKDVNTAINERIKTMTDGLGELGIVAEDVYVDMVNFLPTYAFSEEKKIFSKKTLTEEPTGFRLQKNLHVRYRDAGMLDRIMTAATNAGIYDIVKVDEIVENPQAVYAELREKTFAYLQDLRELYSKQGIALDSARLRVAESAWVVYPKDRYESYSAHASQQLSQADRASANISKVEKPTLRFYNAISYNDYDLVLNPDVLAPTAQFTFSLQVNFLLPEEDKPVPPEVKTVTEKTYFYLTPEGKVVPLPAK
ncbi:MAG: SIMPL domain-containing protein [Bacteroidota bacterium]